MNKGFFENLSLNDTLIIVLTTLFPIFITTVKSWGNGISFALGLLALIHIIKKPIHYFSKRQLQFWFIFVLFLMPFFCELIVQLVRGPFTPNALDGPSRFILGLLFFIFFSKYDKFPKAFDGFRIGAFLCLMFTSTYVFFVDDYFWSTRCATKIMCPNMLPVVILVLGVFAFFYFWESNYGVFIKSITILITYCCTTYIILICETRTVWIAYIIIILLSLGVYSKKLKCYKKLVVISSLLILCTSVFASQLITKRISITGEEIGKITSGNLNTSLGGRLALILIDLHLTKSNPFFGYPDGKLPELSYLKKNLPMINLKNYNMRMNSGSHCEYTAHLARKGFLFGSLTVLAIFIIPFFITLRKVYLLNFQNLAMLSIIFVLISFSICAFGIQVLALKVTNTMWSMILSFLFTLFCHKQLVNIDK